jgi:hypothetical protein
MIESGIGRTERAELGERRPEPRALPEADDGEMRKPRPLLSLVQAEPFEPRVEILRQRSRRTVLVVEDEHPDAPGLAVPGDGEASLSRGPGRLPEGARDRRDIGGGPPPEEGQRDVEIGADDSPYAPAFRELAPLPLDEAVEDVVRKP